MSSNGFLQPTLEVKYLKSDTLSSRDDLSNLFKKNQGFDYKEGLFKVLPKLNFLYYKEKVSTERLIEEHQNQLRMIRMNRGMLDIDIKNDEQIAKL